MAAVWRGDDVSFSPLFALCRSNIRKHFKPPHSLRISTFTKSSKPFSQLIGNRIAVRKMVFTIHSDVRSAIQIASAFGRRGQPQRRLLCPISVAFGSPSRGSAAAVAVARMRVRAFSTDNTGVDEVERVEAKKLHSKPSVCTADELHYVSANNSDWRLALWRYIPPPQVRIHC